MAWGMSAAAMDDAALTAGAHRSHTEATRAAAVRAVASMSRDAGDCAVLLAQLGLDPAEGVSSVERAS